MRGRSFPRRAVSPARLHPYPAHRAAGRMRVDGKRAKPSERLSSPASACAFPAQLEGRKPAARPPGRDERPTPPSSSPITLYEDRDVLVLNKPMGLAVQGGSGDDAPRGRPARGLRAIATGRSRAWCIGWTRIRPAAWWWPRRALGRGDARQSFRSRCGAQDLLGAGRPACRARRAGPHLDLSGQGQMLRRAMPACGSPATATRRQPRGHLLRAGGEWRPEARLARR